MTTSASAPTRVERLGRRAARSSRPSTQSSIGRRRDRAWRPVGEALADPRSAALDRGRVDVVEDDLVAGLERDLGDAGAHRPGADHADDLVRHRSSLGMKQPPPPAQLGRRWTAKVLTAATLARSRKQDGRGDDGRRR